MKIINLLNQTNSTISVQLDEIEIGVIVKSKNRFKFNPTNDALKSLKGNYNDLTTFKKELNSFLESIIDLMSDLKNWNEYKFFPTLFFFENENIFYQNKPKLKENIALIELNDVKIKINPLKYQIIAKNHFHHKISGDYNQTDFNLVDLNLIPKDMNYPKEKIITITKKIVFIPIYQKNFLDTNVELISNNMGQIF